MQSQSIQSPEEWRPVVGFESYYEVSNLGRVRNIADRPSTTVGRILKPKQYRNGRRFVCLYTGSTEATRYVAHLVIEAFIGPRPPDHECNHIDGDKSNDAPQNLEWLSIKEHKRYTLSRGQYRAGEQTHLAKLTEDQVREIRTRYSQKHHESQYALAREYGVTQGAIGLLVRRKNWKHVT